MASLSRIETHESSSSFKEVPEAVYPPTKQDKLWIDLQTLDHDRERSRYVQERKGFLGPEHAQKLEELRGIQMELSEELAREEAELGFERYQELWTITDPDELYQRLYDDRHFDLLNDHVEKTAEKIDEIAAVIDANELNNEKERAS